MTFEIPATVAEAGNVLVLQSGADSAGAAAARNPVFYSGPLDEGGISTGANRALANKCLTEHPDDYYGIGDTEVGEYLDFLNEKFSKGQLPPEFDQAAMDALNRQGSAQFSAAAPAGGHAVAYVEGDLRPGNAFYEELKVQFSELGQLETINGVNLAKLKAGTNGNVEQAAGILGELSQCYAPTAPSGIAPNKGAVEDETWKAAVGLAGIYIAWTLAAVATAAVEVEAAGATIIEFSQGVGAAVLKTAATILP